MLPNQKHPGILDTTADYWDLLTSHRTSALNFSKICPQSALSLHPTLLHSRCLCAGSQTFSSGVGSQHSRELHKCELKWAHVLRKQEEGKESVHPRLVGSTFYKKRGLKYNAILGGRKTNGSSHLPTKSKVYEEVFSGFRHVYNTSTPHHYLKATSLEQTLEAAKTSRTHIPQTREGAGNLCVSRSNSQVNVCTYHLDAIPQHMTLQSSSCFLPTIFLF